MVVQKLSSASTMLLHRGKHQIEQGGIRTMVENCRQRAHVAP